MMLPAPAHGCCCFALPQRLAMCASVWDAVHACMQLHVSAGLWRQRAWRGGQLDVHWPDKPSQVFCGCVHDR